MAAGYALAWTLVWIPFMIAFFFLNSNATAILNTCLNPLQGLFNFLVFMSPKVRSAKQPRRGENLSWRQAFIKAYMSRGERRKTGRNLSSGNIRTGSRVSAWKQRVQRFLKSLLLRTSTRDSSRNNESNNARTTTNHQSSSNTEQDSAPSDMKEDVEYNSMRPQHQALVTVEEEK
jgi:hypothetical protein